jgi:hypothetical protein
MCTSPLKLPLDSARHAPGRSVDTTVPTEMPNDWRACEKQSRMQLCAAGANRAGPRREGATLYCLLSELLDRLVLFLANLLTGSFASERGFHALFLTGLQVKGVSFYLFNNVFLLNFALEPAQGVLEGFTLLKTNFCQTDTPPNQSGRTE